MNYKLATVTICYNNLPDLIKTLQSVDNQKRKPDTHIIIDGSTENAIKNYLENTPQPPYRKWICEPDEGISDAYNKGILNSSGEIIHLLNSGDQYFDDTVVERVMQVFENDETIKWTHGQYKQYLGGMWVITGKRYNTKKLYRGMQKVGHPTMFVKRALYEKYGLFDVKIIFSMDYDFLIRIVNEKFEYLPFPIIIFDAGGQSNVDWAKAHNEVVDIYIKRKGWDFRILYGLIYHRLFYFFIYNPITRPIFQKLQKLKKKEA